MIADSRALKVPCPSCQNVAALPSIGVVQPSFGDLNGRVPQGVKNCENHLYHKHFLHCVEFLNSARQKNGPCVDQLSPGISGPPWRGFRAEWAEGQFEFRLAAVFGRQKRHARAFRSERIMNYRKNTGGQHRLLGPVALRPGSRVLAVLFQASLAPRRSYPGPSLRVGSHTRL